MEPGGAEDPPADDEPVAVPHISQGLKPLVKLFSHRGIQFIRHALTGEVHELPPLPGNQQWSLRSENGWCFVVDAAGERTYASDKFVSSVWSHGGDLYVQTETPTGECITHWLSEVAAKFTRHYASWPQTKDHTGMPRLAHNVYVFPISGASVFFDMSDVQQALAFNTRWAASRAWLSKSLTTWLKHAGASVPATHFLQPVTQDGAGQYGIDVVHVSGAALVWVLLYNWSTMRDTYDRARCLAVLNAFLYHFVPSAVFMFTAEGHAPCDQDNSAIGGDIVSMRLDERDRVLVGPPGLGNIHLRSLVDQSLAEALCIAWGCRARNGILAVILEAVALSLEVHLKDNPWPTDPLKMLTSRGPLGSMRIDESTKAALDELPMSVVRNSYRAGKFMKAIGIRGASHQSLADHQYCRRYIYASRKNNLSATSWGFATDKSRGSGKDWLRGILVPYSTGVPGWTNPVVPLPISEIWTGVCKSSEKFVPNF